MQGGAAHPPLSAACLAATRDSAAPWSTCTGCAQKLARPEPPEPGLLLLLPHTAVCCCWLQEKSPLPCSACTAALWWPVSTAVLKLPAAVEVPAGLVCTGGDAVSWAGDGLPAGDEAPAAVAAAASRRLRPSGELGCVRVSPSALRLEGSRWPVGAMRSACSVSTDCASRWNLR